MCQKLFVIGLSLLLLSCQKQSGNSNQVTLTLGAYTVPKEAYQQKIIPAFQKYWFAKTGQQVKFQESYIASGAQSRAIVAGFEADVAALSLEKDIARLQDVGLVTHNWKNNACKGFVTRSIVVMAVRKGNPLNIKTWQDVTNKGIQVLYPNPKTSGGAMWDINAIYGAGLKYSEIRGGKPNEEEAALLLKKIQKNVKVMDKSGRASVTTFENGIGDVLVTYENEVLARIKQGKEMDIIIPDATVLIENPIAVVDQNVEKHKNRAVAEAFVEFSVTEESQRAFSEFGFRSVLDQIAREFSDSYPEPALLFDIEYLGGWNSVHKNIYGPDGVWTLIIKELADE